MPQFKPEEAQQLMQTVQLVSTVAPQFTHISGECMARLYAINDGLRKAKEEASAPVAPGQSGQPVPPSEEGIPSKPLEAPESSVGTKADNAPGTRDPVLDGSLPAENVPVTKPRAVPAPAEPTVLGGPAPAPNDLRRI